MPKTKKKKTEAVAKKKETLESIQWTDDPTVVQTLGWDIRDPDVKAAVVRLAWDDPSDPMNSTSRAHAAGFLVSTWWFNKAPSYPNLSDILPLWWVSLQQVVKVGKITGCETRDESFRILMEKASVEFGTLMFQDNLQDFVEGMKAVGLPCPDMMCGSKNA